MPPVATPAPAAPAAKPAAQPKPSNDVPIQPIEKPVDFDAELDAEFAAIDDDNKVRTPPKPVSQPKPQDPPKVEAKAEEEDEADPDNEGSEDPAKEEKPKEEKPAAKEEPPKPVKAADLRTAYEGLKKKVKEEFEPKVAKLEAKIKELEASGPETTAPIVEELNTLKKRLEEREADLRFIRYEKSDEFREKYEKPYHEAWQKALADLSELTIQTEDGGTRVATAQDLLHLANLPLGEARTQARALFGDAADDVMAHRRSIRELSSAQTKALEDAKKNSSEHEKKLAAQRQIEHQETIKLWKQANEGLAKKYPKWFSEIEGDDEGNELLRKGFSLADLHFTSAKNLTPEQIESLPPKFRDAIKANGDLNIRERVALDALLRHKIASHSRIARNLKQANAKIKELEKSLAEYESSEPPAGKSGGKPSKPSMNPMEEAQAELDKLDVG